MLVEQGVDGVDERLVAVEEAVAPGEQIAFEPPLASVFAEDFHDAPVGRQVIVVGYRFRHPCAVGGFEYSGKAVRGRLVRTEQTEVPILFDAVSQERPPEPRRRGVDATQLRR